MKPDPTSYSSLVREILNIGELTDKVICIIPEWETHGGIKIMPPNKAIIKDYIYYEKYLQQRARKMLLNDGVFYFYAFHEGENNVTKFLSEAEDKAIKLIKRSAPENQILDVLHAFIDPYIILLEANKENLEFAKSRKTKIFKISVLCIDYKYFNNKILYYYLLYLDYFYETPPKKKISEKLKPLFNLFSDMYIGTRFETNSTLKNIIKSCSNNELTSEDYDLANFLSANHIQNIVTPFFWKQVTEEGFYLGGNNLKTKEKEKRKDDFRFFYSLESLLFYELTQMMNKTRRCKNCNAILPLKMNGKNFKGLYCQSGFKNFKACNRQRNTKRQRLFKKVTS